AVPGEDDTQLSTQQAHGNSQQQLVVAVRMPDDRLAFGSAEDLGHSSAGNGWRKHQAEAAGVHVASQGWNDRDGMRRSPGMPMMQMRMDDEHVRLAAANTLSCPYARRAMEYRAARSGLQVQCAALFEWRSSQTPSDFGDVWSRAASHTRR